MPSERDVKVKKPMDGTGVNTHMGQDLEEISISTGVSAPDSHGIGRDHTVKKDGGV